MSTNQISLSEVHLHLDPYQDKHTGYFYNTKGNRELLTLGKKTLRENIFNWVINPFDPSELDTLEYGSSVNSKYTLTVHGSDFLKTYLELMRRGAEKSSQLNCSNDIMLAAPDIPWTFQERIEKFLFFLDFIGLNFPLDSIRIINPTIDIYISSNTDTAALENLLQQNSSFSRVESPEGDCWLYKPYEILAAQFRLVSVYEDEFTAHHGTLIHIDDQSPEYVDIRHSYDGHGSNSYHFWSLNSQNFCDYLRDFLTFRYQMPTFSRMMQKIYNFMDPEQRGCSFFLKSLTEKASAFRNVPANDKSLFEKLIPFICLNCSSHIYEITEASSILIRKGRTATIKAVVYPRIPLKNRMLSFSCSRDGVVRVQMNNNDEGSGIAELTAVEVGETEVFFYDGLSERSFGSISIEVNDPTYCKEITWNQSPIVMPTDSCCDVGISCTPPNALDVDHLKWSTNNRKVAYADGNGTVHAGVPGTATLTVQGEDTSAQVQVTVKRRIESIETSQRCYESYVNQYIPIQCWAEPDDCFDPSINFSIENPTVAAWDNQQGQFIARSQGETNIKFYSPSNPEIFTTVNLKVSFVPEPAPPVIRTLYTLTILWILLCWTSYIPMVLFTAQVYYGIKSVEEERKNIFIVALIFTIQILIQLFIL